MTNMLLIVAIVRQEISVQIRVLSGIMDVVGNIWERRDTEWRAVVRGPTVQGFVAAWVSPTGKVVAVTRDEVYVVE